MRLVLNPNCETRLPDGLVEELQNGFQMSFDGPLMVLDPDTPNESTAFGLLHFTLNTEDLWPDDNEAGRRLEIPEGALDR